MFQTSVITSGSKGNCVFVKNGHTQIVIDAGISFKYFSKCLTDLGLDCLKLDGIFISHEHSDHVGGAGILHRKTAAPIYISHPTFIYSEKKIGKINQEPFFFETGNYIQVGSLIIHPFNSPHDAIDSCNFLIHPVDDDKRQLLIATDMGFAHNLLKVNLKKATTIVLESNHDVKMLRDGPYEWYLKQRILSKSGHLSNEQATNLVEEVLGDQHERIILAHLSEINNTPDLAYSQMKNMLDTMQAKLDLLVSSQYENTPLFQV
ncbi:MAG: MBL fold metallo-hydrolase [Candidatus Cloacimonetes bacterium]|nr:MBL fold metallo-hydrolase [Candidatus Cloacimonadota bacterium]